MSTPNTLSPEQAHHHSLISLIVAGVLAFLVGLVFWFVSQDKPLPVYNTNNESGIIDEVAALLTNAKTRATEAEISRIAATLTKSKTTVSSAEREKISVILESY